MKPAAAPTKKKLSTLCLSLLLTGVWSGCKKSEPQAAPSPAAGSAAAAPGQRAGAPVNALVASEARLGMAARMPQDVGFYFGSANLKGHLAALRKTAYWGSVKALIDDKKPSDGKGDSKKKAVADKLEEFEAEDFFFAMGSESAPSMRWLIDLNRIYGEYTYRTLMTGFTGGKGAGSNFDPGSILANSASSPELVERICGLLERAEVPPLLYGAKTPQAEKLMADILQAKTENGPPWLASMKEGKLTTETGGSLTTYEGTLAIWLTPEQRAEWMDTLKPVIKDPALLTRVQTTLDTLAAKKVSFGIGVNEGYLIMAMGRDLNHVRFVKNVQDSLLARADLAPMAAHANKDLLGMVHVDAKVLEALHDDQPLTPMLQSALGGLAGVPVFAELTQTVQPKLAALATAEKDFHRRTFTNGTGVFWWENGLNFDMVGGLSADDAILNKPLKFGALLDTPGAIFASVGHSPNSVAGRAYFERWMELLYVTAGGFIQAGLGGDNAAGIYALADKGVIPPLVEIYKASRTMYQDGLGTESAFLIDLKGTAAHLPTSPTPQPGQAVEPTKVPRMTSVYDVRDRAVVAQSWQKIEVNLNTIFASLPTPLPPMAPMNSKSDGLTTWYYPMLALAGNDLLPCVSVSDQVFMLGTSKNLHAELAVSLAKPPAAPLQGTHYRMAFAPIREFLKDAGPSPIPGVAAEKAGTALPFIAPFGDLRGQISLTDDGRFRNTFHLEAKDVRRVD